MSQANKGVEDVCGERLFLGEEIKWVNTGLPRMRRGSVFLYDLWRERFFLKVRWRGWRILQKKKLKKTPAGRVSPEQPVGGIGLRASGSRAGQFHNVRNYFESSRQPKGVSLQAKKS